MADVTEKQEEAAPAGAETEWWAQQSQPEPEAAPAEQDAAPAAAEQDASADTWAAGGGQDAAAPADVWGGGGGGTGGGADSWGNKDAAAPADAWGGGGGGAGGGADSWGNKDAPADAWGGGGGGAGGGADSWGNKDASADAWGGGGGGDQWGSASGGGGGGWGATSGGGGGWGSTDAPAVPSAKEYWEWQAHNTSNNLLPGKDEWALANDDKFLFELRSSTEGIDFSRYDSVPVNVSGEKSEMIPICHEFEAIYNEFKEFFPEELYKNITRCGYTKPTPVQKYAIPVGLVGRDIMCCAQTGSGKTAAYLIPVVGRMLKHLDTPVGGLQTPFTGECNPDSLIIAPTRELVIQIHEESVKFTHRTPFRSVRVYGGEPPKVQMETLAKGADLMVATPGRLVDFMQRGIIKMEKTFVLVLDEADRMLDMGFESSIRDIVQNNGMPAQASRQTLMFSATFPEACQRMATDYLFNYIWIGVGIVGGAVTTVQQSLEKVTAENKFDRLMQILDDFTVTCEKDERMLIFVNTKATAKWLDEQLYDKKFDTGCLHGDLTQEQREQNLGRFKKCEVNVMMATDVAARGLDIPKVSLVVNYDLPGEAETYVHRIGRSGRIGNKGKAITMVTFDSYERCMEKMAVLERMGTILKESDSEVPDWLEPLVASGGVGSGGGGWSSDKGGGKDYRQGQTSFNADLGNNSDAWSNWKPSGGGNSNWGADNGGDSWNGKKDDAWGGGAAAAADSWGGSGDAGASGGGGGGSSWDQDSSWGADKKWGGSSW